ncbi:MAG: fatty acid amide hydrolase 2 [Actinomycetota bacterium]|nr:fatty acid amide hydrolase 2 [Actinomycetota bacterium]
MVRAHIDHIKTVNPTLNAVVEDRFDDALKEADAADERIAAGEHDLPPLLGVPCTIKEFFAVPGMKQTSGLVSHKNHVATEEATTVTRLRSAGAIPMGTTNVSELGMWMESSNKVYGRTNNAYDSSRIAGGSSGGEGAIVGAGGSPFGLGSDIGGSIRMPAFFNGVFGHKPTGGMVPGTGQVPLSENDALRYLCTGPIARRAEDLMPLLRILAGPDGIDSGSREFELGDPDSVDLSSVTVLDVRGNGFLRVSSALKESQGRVADALAAKGAVVRRLRIDALKRSLEIWSALMQTAADTTFSELLGDGSKIPAGRELLKWGVGKSDHTFPAIALALLEKGVDLMPNRTARFVKMGHELRDELAETIGPNGVLLYPPYTMVAPRHNVPLFPPINWIYTAIFNVAELPVTQVPLGLTEKGLPLGIQVAAAPGNDHLTIAVAQVLEETFGGWVPPQRFFGSSQPRSVEVRELA